MWIGNWAKSRKVSVLRTAGDLDLGCRVRVYEVDVDPKPGTSKRMKRDFLKYYIRPRSIVFGKIINRVPRHSVHSYRLYPTNQVEVLLPLQVLWDLGHVPKKLSRFHGFGVHRALYSSFAARLSASCRQFCSKSSLAT